MNKAEDVVPIVAIGAIVLVLIGAVMYATRRRARSLDDDASTFSSGALGIMFFGVLSFTFFSVTATLLNRRTFDLRGDDWLNTTMYGGSEALRDTWWPTAINYGAALVSFAIVLLGSRFNVVCKSTSRIRMTESMY